jgi:hypothetical protein
MGRKDGERNGGGLFRRPKLTLSCSAEGKEGRKEDKTARQLLVTYIGESESFHNDFLKHAVLAALFILQAGRSLYSPHDCKIVLTLTGQLLCQHSRVNMDALISIYTKEEQHAVI